MRKLIMLCTFACSAAVQGATLEFTGEAEKFMPDLVSRETSEQHATSNARFGMVVFGCEDCPEQQSTDLFLAMRPRDVWIGPGLAPMSRPTAESLPSFSSDGYWLYFVSDRHGFGGTDLFRIYVKRGQSFGPPENLGGSINSTGDEGAAAAGERGNTTYFASRGREGAKGWDLFVSYRRAGKMTPGERLPTIDTRADEFDPALLANDAGLVFARSQAMGKKPAALWFAPRKGEGFGEPVKLGAAVNLAGKDVRGAQEDWSAPGHLLFTRDGDIWRIAYRIVE